MPLEKDELLLGAGYDFNGVGVPQPKRSLKERMVVRNEFWHLVTEMVLHATSAAHNYAQEKTRAASILHPCNMSCLCTFPHLKCAPPPRARAEHEKDGQERRAAVEP
eukprot:365025-Chlamydomonas_euryale.AAC.11